MNKNKIRIQGKNQDKNLYIAKNRENINVFSIFCLKSYILNTNKT